MYDNAGMRKEATLGLRAHSGWAVMIAVSDGAPVLRRRIMTVTATGDRATQPYHAAAVMKTVDAQAFLDRYETAAVETTATEIGQAIRELGAAGYQVRRAVILLGSGKPLPDLSKILAAHPLIHTAEGVFFRNVLMTACTRCGLSTSGYKEREIPAELLRETKEMGGILGPPWTQDEKLSAAAALIPAR